jgi:hypothetical protein
LKAGGPGAGGAGAEKVIRMSSNQNQSRNEVIQWVKKQWEGQGVSEMYRKRGILAISMPLIMSTYEWTSEQDAIRYSQNHPEHTVFFCRPEGLILWEPEQ